MPLPIICFQPPVSQPLAPYEDSPVGDKYGGRYVLHLATVHEHIGLVGLRALCHGEWTMLARQKVDEGQCSPDRK
eukprot:1138103-Pelagomonas_calceolata.AAC.7